MENINEGVEFLKLPDELIMFIFGKVDNIKDFDALSLVCHKFSNLVRTDTLYRTVKIKEDTPPRVAVNVLKRYRIVIKKLKIDRYLGPEEGKEVTDEIHNLKNLEALSMHDIYWFHVSVRDIRKMIFECKKLTSLKLDDVNVKVNYDFEWETVLSAMETRKMKKIVLFVKGEYGGRSLREICRNSRDTLECFKVKPKYGFIMEDLAVCRNLKTLDLRFYKHTRVSARPLMKMELTKLCLIFAVVENAEYIEFFSRPCAAAMKKVELLDCFYVTPDEVIVAIMRNCVNLVKIGIKVEIHDCGEDMSKGIIFHVLNAGKKLKYVSLSPMDATDVRALQNINAENYPNLLSFTTFAPNPLHDYDENRAFLRQCRLLEHFHKEVVDSTLVFPPKILLEYFKDERYKKQLLYLNLMLHVTN